jgi:5'-deoxynucleotidase YfbR-like HD superfamily hydrolase
VEDGYIQTYSGLMVNPLTPRCEDITIGDIAHSLSLKTRFNGHCDIFYCVSEHSVRCARYLQRQYGNQKLSLAGLLHDAAEAYLCDIPSPLKPHIPGFKQMESRLMEVIVGKYGVAEELHDQRIKEADFVLLSTETRDLVGNMAHERWGSKFGRPLAEKIVPLSPREAEVEFLSCFAAFYGVSSV